MSSKFIEQWKQLDRYRKDLNVDFRSSESGVVIGKIPHHFLNRLHERIQLDYHDKALSGMFNYIIKQPQRLRECAHGSELRITNSICSIVLEIRHGVPTELDPKGLNIVVTPKTLFSSQGGWNKFNR